MFGYAEGQTLFLGVSLPVTHHVAVRLVVHGVPFVQLRIPQEGIIVMRAHAHEVSRTGFLTEAINSSGSHFSAFESGMTSFQPFVEG